MMMMKRRNIVMMMMVTMIVASVCIVQASVVGRSHDNLAFVEVKSKLQSMEQQPEFKGVTFNRRLLVNATMRCEALETINLTVVGDVTTDTVKCSRVSSSLVSTDVLETGIIRSPTGTITIDGNLVIAGGEAQSATSFLATEVIVGGVRQWSLLHHDDFEHGMDGWKAPGRGSCGDDTTDHFLGGHCKTSSANATKIFRELPKHAQVRVTARVHFIDRWSGEAAYLRANERIIWADTASSPNFPEGEEVGLGNVCGGPLPDSRLSVPVDVTFAHEGSELELTFGSSLQSDPCEGSWAVDDVIVYTK